MAAPITSCVTLFEILQTRNKGGTQSITGGKVLLTRTKGA